MSKKLTAALAILICLFLDTILFPRLNILDIRPDAMLAATVSFGVLTSSLSGAVFGVTGGMLIDILAGRYVGLHAAIYLVAGMVAGFFYKKFYADNIIIPAVTASILGFLKDIFFFLITVIIGARFAYLGVLLRYALPSALLSGILCGLIHLLFKPLLLRQTKRGQAEKINP